MISMSDYDLCRKFWFMLFQQYFSYIVMAVTHVFPKKTVGPFSIM